MLPKCPLMLPREIGACAWLEQVGSLRSPSQAHAPITERTTENPKTQYTKPVFTTVDSPKAQQPTAGGTRRLTVLARGFVAVFSVALSHLRYHFSAYSAHI